MNNICQALIYEELSVLKAYNPINPTLNTIGVQCGGYSTHPMRTEGTCSRNRLIEPILYIPVQHQNAFKGRELV
jgi:hypothetical protein